MLPMMANLARMGRSEWLIKRCGNPESKSSVRGGGTKEDGPCWLTRVYSPLKRRQVPSSSVREWSTMTFEADSSGWRFS